MEYLLRLAMEIADCTLGDEFETLARNRCSLIFFFTQSLFSIFGLANFHKIRPCDEFSY